MKKYIVDEYANRNMAGRVDTAVVYDTETPQEKLDAFQATLGTPDFHGWQDNPAIVAIFNIDPNDPDDKESIAEYDAWLKDHSGMYEYANAE